MPRPLVHLIRLGLGAAALLGAATARAQVPLPRVPDIHQRSGLLSRFVPIEPHLPPDDDRDNFYGTRWGDHPPGDRINSRKDGGLYGRTYKSRCTSCYYPYFHGSPGQNATNPDCEPCPRGLRLVTNLVHPFRPVCHYYAGGCYVPIYDLDPLVPGPGPFPWPHFFKRPTGG
jgi:hypothetical protein